MAIIFPRDFPLDGCFTDDCEFDLIFPQSRSLTGSASPDVADVTPAYWVGTWNTKLMTREKFALWDAWLTSLRGGLRLFKGRPNRHRWPMAYPRGFAGLTVGGDAFSGLGNLAVIGAGRDVVTINALPVGFVLKTGDWFSIPAGPRQRLHRITEGGVANGFGAAQVSCEPTIVQGVSTGVAVRLDTPYCEMNLSSTPKKPRDPIKGGRISFSGQQILI